MNINHFFYVVEIADTHSFSQAARNLYISQPNLSYAVKQIENKVGFSLFERTSKGVFPTPQGQEVVEQFRILRQEYMKVEDFLRTPLHCGKLYLNIGALNVNRTAKAFTNIIHQYIKSPIHFSFLTYSYMDDLLPDVENAKLDFAVIGILSPYLKQTQNHLSNSSIEYFPIANVPICALVGNENPLYNNNAPITLAQLYSHTIIQYGNPSRDPHHSVPYVLGLSSRCYGEIHVSNSQLFYQTIQNTTAVGLIAATLESFDSFNDYPNIRILPIADCNVTAQYGYIKSRRIPLSNLAADVIKELRPLF